MVVDYDDKEERTTIPCLSKPGDKLLLKNKKNKKEISLCELGIIIIFFLDCFLSQVGSLFYYV